MPCALTRRQCTVPADVLKVSHTATLKTIGEGGSLPGFRNAASAPPRVLVQAVGVAKFRAACVEHVLQAVVEEALAPVAAVAFKDSEKITTGMEAMGVAFAGPACEPVAEGMTLVVEVDVLPSVAWRSAYSALQVTLPPLPADPEAAALAAAEAALQERVKELGDLRVVAGRSLALGDVVRCNLSAKKAASGDLILQLQHKSLFLDTANDTAGVPGLAALLVGMAAGEQRTLAVTFPPDWPVEALRSVEASVLVAVAEVFERSLPALEDSLAP